MFFASLSDSLSLLACLAGTRQHESVVARLAFLMRVGAVRRTRRLSGSGSSHRRLPFPPLPRLRLAWATGPGQDGMGERHHPSP